MAKDSQIDPKGARKKKSGGGQTMAQSGNDNQSRSGKKQSGSRHKPGDDKK